ncbi:MAG: hypothetical protein V4691_05685 [Pseudomonadota bacterium]
MFGEDTSLAIRLVFALIIILALIGGVVLVLRRFGLGNLGTMNMHGRQPRLAVMDVAHLDPRRKLIIVRRDTVEHLIMVGGPTDVVIETGIVRGQPAHAHDDKLIHPVMPAMPKMDIKPAAPKPVVTSTETKTDTPAI